MKKWLTMFFVVVMMLSITACSQKNDSAPTKKQEAAPKVLKIGAIPDQSAADITRSMGDVAKYLADKTGMKVEFVPSVDYAALVTAFQRGDIQLAWFGGLTGVQARSLVPGAEAIAQRPRDAEFHSVFITQKDSGIQKLTDLKGKSFTFGSESSTSGHLMPRYYLMQAGINANTDFDGKPNFSGSHDTTYKLVESGAFKAGALNEAVWQQAVTEGKVDSKKVVVFYTTPPFFDYNWTINNVDKATKKKVKDALLSMGSGQKGILDLFQTDKFVQTKNENYIPIEKVAKELKIIK